MKRITPLLMAVILACAMTCPALAAEAPEGTAPVRPAALYPTEIVETETGSGRRLEKVYLLTAADNPANIPTADFEREGYRYTLLDVTRLRCSAGDLATFDLDPLFARGMVIEYR